MIEFMRIWPTAVLMLAVSAVQAQQDVPPAYVLHPNQEARVHDLSSKSAPSTDPAAVLAAALETVFRDANVCCGKNSALQDRVESADPLSLQDVCVKLQGKHTSGDGHAITVSTEYMTPDSINPGRIISNLLSDRALLVEWKSRLYVLYGAAFDEKLYYSGQRDYVIHKLFLLDVRFSESRREVIFNRESDDWAKVQGLLLLSAAASQ